MSNHSARLLRRVCAMDTRGGRRFGLASFVLWLFAIPGVFFPLSLWGKQPSSRLALDSIDSNARATYARANSLLDNRQWREAVEAIRAMMDSSGDKLVRVSGSATVERLGFSKHITVRQLGHRWLASLVDRAPEALDIYRDQVDPLAGRWYREAVAELDEPQLRRIVDEMFVSRFGDDALFWLGELARQRGAYTLARNYWERIAWSLRYIPPAGDAGDTELGGRDAYPWWLLSRAEDDGAFERSIEAAGHARGTSWLAYPDSDRDLAELRARLVLLSVLEGNRRRAAAEIDWLRRTAAGGEGTVAGRRGNLADLTEHYFAASEGWPDRPDPPGWPTFAGAPQRFKRLAAPLDLGGRPIWIRPLPRLSVVDQEPVHRRLRVAEDAAGLLSIHPLTMANLVVFAAGLRVEDIEAVRLQTGQVFVPRRQAPAQQEIPHLPGAPTVPRITLTAHGSTLFALTVDTRNLPARLVALDMAAQRKLVYSVSLEPPHWQGRWIFEGAPITDGQVLYVAVRRVDQVRHETQVACFDVRDGQLRWRRKVCQAETEPEMSSGYLSNLLSLDQETLYYNSNMGIVAALRAQDGFPRWVVQYPVPQTTHPGRNDLHRYRDLTPCLVYRDLVIAAPRDCDRMFALDALSGSLRWATPPELAADAVHLLGVGHDRLIASGECLYWFDIDTGQLVGRFPGTFLASPGHARPTPRGYGRGLLAGDQIYWPTREAIYVFQQRTVKTDFGWQPRLVRRIELAVRGATGGNLLLQDGVLLIASADQLYAFNETGKPQHGRHGPGGRSATEPGVSANHR